MQPKPKKEAAVLSIEKNLQTKSEELSLRFNRFLNPEKVNDLLAQCIHLRKLDLRAVKILPKPKTLRALKNLEYLDMSHTSLKDISFLKGLVNIEQLYLNHTLVEDVGILQNLEFLNYLNLAHTRIQEVTALQNLTWLEYLEIERNPIRDISCLKEMEQLCRLSVSCEFLEPYPPIWYAHLSYKSGEEKLGNLNQLPELPFVEKIWQLMATHDEDNLQLARQLAQSQGWTEEDFKAYQFLLEYYYY